MLFGRDIGIDLGTSSVILCVKNKGVILREPSVVAMDKTNGRLLNVGMAAQRMLGRTPGNIVAILPLKDGVVSDYEMTERLLKELVDKVTNFSFFKPRMLMSVSCGVSEVEERAVIDAGIAAGARKVYLIEAPLAAAIGAGVDVSKADGNLVIDIGGGTADIAVISLNGVVECESVKVGGNAFNDAVIRYIRKKHNVLIGDSTAEEIKKTIGSISPRQENPTMEVKGRDLATGLPKVVSISASDTTEAFTECIERILEALHTVLEKTPPELVADISHNGIVLTGGSSLIWGFDRLLQKVTGIPTRIADDAEQCVAFGISKALENIENMHEGTINIARRMQIRS